MKRYACHLVACGFFLGSLFLPGLVRRARAQEAPPLIRAQIVQISGQTLYLDAGSNQGIATGDTLTLYTGENRGGIRGRLRVIAAISQSASVQFLGTPFALTRGEQIYFTTQSLLPRQASSAPSQPDTLHRHSIMDNRSSFTTSPALRVSPILTGRVMTGAYLNFSRTRFSSLDPNWVRQTFASPYVNLMLRGRELPGNLQFDVNLRWSYRYLNRRPLSPANLLSIYNLQLTKTFRDLPLLSLSLGRFYNPYERFSGFWDGVMLRYGSYRNGVGVITGFEPSLSSQGFSTTLPKHSVFAYTSEEIGPVHASSEISFNALYPRNNWQNHLFWGLHQDFRYGRSLIGGSIQVDRDPTRGTWTLTQGYLQARLELAGGLSADAHWLRQRPYQIWQTPNPISYSRTSYGGGLSYDFPGGYLSADASLDQGDLTSGAHTYSLYGSLQNTGIWGLGFNGQGQYWISQADKALSAGGGLSRWFGQKQVELGYDFYRTDFLGQAVATHSITLHLYLPIMNKMILDLQGRYDMGRLTQNKNLYLSLWYNF